MVSFSKDGRYIASANEGEPNADYSIDPEGSVTLAGLNQVGPLQAKVTQIDFKAFNQGQSRTQSWPTRFESRRQMQLSLKILNWIPNVFW